MTNGSHAALLNIHTQNMWNREVFLVPAYVSAKQYLICQNEQTHALQKSTVRYRNVTLVCNANIAETSRTRGPFPFQVTKSR